MNLREQFKRDKGIDLSDTEIAGKFPYYNPFKGRSGSISRGQGWKFYAEWLESRPQHKEIVWKGNIAFCGNIFIGRIGIYQESDVSPVMSDVYNMRNERVDQRSSKEQAKLAVEQAFTNFYQSVTK